MENRYLESAATKYLARWRQKDGIKDLKKSLSYARKLETVAVASDSGLSSANCIKGFSLEGDLAYRRMLVALFCMSYGLNPLETQLITLLSFWERKQTVTQACELLEDYIKKLEDKDKEAWGLAQAKASAVRQSLQPQQDVGPDLRGEGFGG